MNQFAKTILTNQKSSIIFVIFGSILVILSYFFPYAISSENELTLYEWSFRFMEEVAFKKSIPVNAGISISRLLLLLFIFYPYILSLFIPISLFTKKTQLAHFSKIILMILIYIGLIVNLYVYIGQFLLQQRGFFVAILGIILFGSMILSFYNFQKLRKLQTYLSSQIIYLGLIGGVFIFTVIAMIFILMILNDFHMLIGSLCSLIGSLFMISGLVIYLQSNKLSNPDQFNPITERKVNKKKPFVSRMKKKRHN